MAKQMQYIGWSSEADAASMHQWTKSSHLLDVVRRLQRHEGDIPQTLMYAKRLMCGLKRFSFSRTKRFPCVWDPVKISEGRMKDRLDELELLIDKASAISANDYDYYYTTRWWELMGYNSHSSLSIALFDALYFISYELLDNPCFTSRDSIEKALGITWKRGPKL